MNNFLVRIETLGCRLNQTESESLTALFFQNGFSLFPHLQASEKKMEVALCIVNTCTVTGKAEQKARRIIRLLLKEHKNALLLITGCYAELEAKEIEKIDERVITFSGRKKDALSELPVYIKRMFKESYGINENNFYPEDKQLKEIILSFKKEIEQEIVNTDVTDENLLKNFTKDKNKIFKLSSPLFLLHSRAALKIQDGCNNACSFCRIRLARGKAVSLPAEEALARLQKLEKQGAKEAVISGVNLSQYSDGSFNFARLLALFLKNTDEIKLRISSLYPETITEEILPILENTRICPHFHLSVQSGSDIILEKMRRRYRREDIFRAVNSIRAVKKKPFLGCDIITGFPGEDEECFKQTFSMCTELKFAGIHAFPFSARPGTEAYKMTPKIPERIAGERTAVLNLLAEKNYKEYLKICEGETFSAIVEKPVLGKPVKAVTENYLSLKLIYNRKLLKEKSEVINNFSAAHQDTAPFARINTKKHTFPSFKGGEQINVKIQNGLGVII